MKHVAIAIVLAGLVVAPAWAGPREEARKIHDRLVGVPPSESVLAAMATKVGAGDSVGAAYDAMQNPLFYTSTVKNFATPWTNEAQTVFAPLNDYAALVIGMVRDDVPFNTVLTADLAYVGAPGVVAPAYSFSDNEHYEELEDERADLANPAVLVPVTQSGLAGAQIPSGQTAGVLTTRAAGEAFFSAGTNRRMWRFTAMNFLCRDMEQLHDITRATDRVRQDVSRAPGGDSAVFLNQCTGCHSGMDAVAGAFAYFEYDQEAERVIYTAGNVQGKHLINAGTFPLGYETTDDSWVNYWRAGPHAAVGWNGPGAGNGPKSLGEEVTSSRAFSVCQVEKVFAHVCLRGASTQDDRDEIERIADVFETENYSLKRVFAEVASHCAAD